MPSLNNMFKTAAVSTRKILSGTERTITRNYREALRNTRAQMMELYEKYSIEGKLTYAEMSKYNRLDNLNNSLSREVGGLYNKNNALTRQLGASVYTENYFRYAWALETDAAYMLDFGLVNKETIRASVQSPMSGLKLNQRLNKNQAAATISIKETITQGLMRGSGVREMATRIKGFYNGDVNKALRLTRTETNRNQTQGQLASFDEAEKLGIEIRRVWVATLDARTRDTHAILDGQIADADGNFDTDFGPVAGPGLFGVASQDIHCRCAVIAEPVDYPPKVRRARDEGLIDYKTYEEWKREKASS